MKIFIDSAEFSEIEAAAKTGLIDGVTTNPSLVAKSGVRFEDLLRRICETVDGDISAEVNAMDTTGMLREGRSLHKIQPKKIVVKVPLTFEGLTAVKAFAAEGIRTNVTLCFTTVQALLAAKAGATYISPFVGRLDDIGQDGMELIQDIRSVYDCYSYKTEVLSASIRHVEHVLQSARSGADVATIPYKVFTQLLNHPLTTSGIERFLKDWEGAKK